MTLAQTFAGALKGRDFWKMTGSGNDFVFFDVRRGGGAILGEPELVRAICDRRTGVGSDGVVLLEETSAADFRMIYFNSDGSRASFCGNAALCSSRLAVDLGAADPAGFRFESDAGLIRGRIRDGLPEVDLPGVSEVADSVPIRAGPDERRAGFAVAGVPHAVILCGDADRVAIEARGRAVRHDPRFPDGANVDFVSPAGGSWRMRTFERGVEGETLACGTGAVASAILLATWGESSEPETRIVTSSGLPLTVRLRRAGSTWEPSLRGGAALTFRGTLLEVGLPQPLATRGHVA
jgi:diaminopimelate epimerase